MKVVRIFAALVLFSSALYAAPKSNTHKSNSTAATTASSTTGPTSGAVVVKAGGALAQDGSDTVPAGTTGTIVAGPKTVNGVVYVNVNWNGTAAFQGNYNGWVADASLSAAGTTTTPPPTTPPPTTPPPTTPPPTTPPPTTPPPTTLPPTTPPPTTPPPTTPPPTTPPPTTPTTPTGLKIIGYYPRYAIEDGFYPKNLITKGTASQLTHINFAFANIVGNKCASFNTADDYTTKVSAANSVSGVADTSGSLAGTFHQFQELKAKYPNLKIIVSIGGGSVNPSVIATAANASNRAAFVQSCINMYIKGNFGGGITGAGIFDGFDIDWEFPASSTDRSNFTGLLSEFRSQLDAVKSGYTLSIAGPNGQWAWQYIDLLTVQKYLTYVNIMTYDYAGPWNNETGLVSPLYRSSNDPSPTDNGSSSVEGYEAAGMPASKLTFGVPFYGYEWGSVPNQNNGLFEPGSPANQGANATTIVAAEPKFKQYRDSISQSPYLFDGSHFWTYEDATSIKFKMAYVKNQQLAGVMIWNLEQDLSDGTLFNAVASGLASSN